ncbi:MAG TPA: PilZ domain-containing protein [Chloroflexota bacterium]|jgi:c-di-GMP-binding flagellar brake protein YcgR|nr:PilZ domain-containing protein [Chloroflexota bacterium]
MPRPSEALTIGQRLELGFGDEQLVWLPSRLEDLRGDLVLTVAWPTDHTLRLIPVAPGTTLELSASTRDAIYSATVLVQRVSRTDVPLLTVEVRGDWRRTQRRNAVRTSVAVRPRVADVMFGEHSRSLRLAVTNVSASGVHVRSQDELRQGDLLDLAFELMGLEGEVRVQARVRRVQRHERVWDAGCEFEGIPGQVAQRIVQFIFAQQRLRAQARRGGR